MGQKIQETMKTLTRKITGAKMNLPVRKPIETHNRQVQ